MANNDKIVAVLLSGGAGARLWPLSREALPKPFIKLPDGDSLLQKTVGRVLALGSVRQALTVTNRDYYFLARDEYAATDGSGCLEHDFLLEPRGRNTAPAIAAAARHVAHRHGDDAVMLVLPADHIVADPVAFAVAVGRAAALVGEGWLVTFGITPTRAETGYGYLEVGVALAGEACYRVDRFVEKPDEARAKAMVAGGRHLWNSGMFCFTAKTILAELASHAPEVLVAADRALEAGAARGMPLLLDDGLFAAAPDISIDRAVMERSDRVAVVAASMGWEDVGSWMSYAQLTPADGDGNRANGEAMVIDSQDCYFQSSSKVVAAIGVRDLIVVDTPDALLISHKDSVQRVKEVVSELKAMSHAAVRHHQTVPRPWGTYTVLEEGAGFKIKRLVVRPGASISLQRHRHRSEHWVVVSGQAVVRNEGAETVVERNESTFISAGAWHRLTNSGTEDCVLIEVQVGSYVGEDDIERNEDMYGRVPAVGAV